MERESDVVIDTEMYSEALDQEMAVDDDRIKCDICEKTKIKFEEIKEEFKLNYHLRFLQKNNVFM